MEGDIYYSTDEETFNDEDWRESAERAFDDVDIKLGDIRVIYSGEAIKKKMSDFMPHIIDQLSEMAYEECGEYAESFPNSNIDQDKELILALNEVVDSWADKHNLQPNFYGIKNIKEVKVKIIDIEIGEYELID